MKGQQQLSFSEREERYRNLTKRRSTGPQSLPIPTNLHTSPSIVPLRKTNTKLDEPARTPIDQNIPKDISESSRIPSMRIPEQVYSNVKTE